MRALLADYERLTAAGRPLGRAVVTSVWGSAPRAEGASMLATADGVMAGSVSGGCVEAAVTEEIGAALARGTPRLVTFGVSDEQAWEVGLACGGTIKVFVEPAVRPEVLAAARGPGGEVGATVVEGALLGRLTRVFDDGRKEGGPGPGLARGPGGEIVATVVEGALLGRSARVFDDGRMEGDLGPGFPRGAVEEAALDALRRENSTTLALETPAGAASVFLEVFPRQPRLVIFG